MSVKEQDVSSMRSPDEPAFQSRRGFSIPIGETVKSVTGQENSPTSWTVTTEGLSIYKGRELVALVPLSQGNRLIAKLSEMIDLAR